MNQENCPLLFDCHLMTGEGGYECLNYFVCYQEVKGAGENPICPLQSPLLLNRKKIPVYPHGEHLELADALVVKFPPSVPTLELIERGWGEAVPLYPSWDKICREIPKYVENNILAYRLDYNSVDCISHDVYVDSIYITGSSQKVREFCADVFWCVFLSYDGCAADNYRLVQIIRNVKIKIKIASGKYEYTTYSDFKPNPKLKIIGFYPTFPYPHPYWLVK